MLRPCNAGFLFYQKNCRPLSGRNCAVIQKATVSVSFRIFNFVLKFAQIQLYFSFYFQPSQHSFKYVYPTVFVIFILTYLFTPWREANRFSASQEIPPHFMETEGSLPHSHVTATCPYPEPTRSSQVPTSHFLKIHLNIILPSCPPSSN